MNLSDFFPVIQRTWKSTGKSERRVTFQLKLFQETYKFILAKINADQSYSKRFKTLED